MYRCSECWYETTLNLMKRCPDCWKFWTIQLVPWTEDEKKSWTWKKKKVKITDIKETGVKLKDYVKIKENKSNRIKSIDESFNTFFWGWLTKGSINLISWTAWVWKSTFLWYLAKFFPDKKVLYISAEETTNQILERTLRMKKGPNDFDNFIVYSESSLEQISAIIQKEEPDIVIIDSLQMLQTENSAGEKGWLKQQKYIAEKIIQQIKKTDISLFLVWHVTKNEEIAWAQYIEHVVDAVIKIEPAWERGDDLKIMTNLKNRFSGEDILIYEMYEDKINIVSNKKMLDLFIQEAAIWEPGNTLSVVTLPKSTQIFLVEIQSIVSDKDWNYSKKIINKFNRDEFDNITKIIGTNLDSSIFEKDINVNIFSPLRQNSDELSLWIIMSIFSFLRWLNVWKRIFLWKVWFRGEIKSINRQQSIIEKLKKYGVKEEDIISNKNYKNIKDVATLLLKENKKTKK